MAIHPTAVVEDGRKRWETGVEIGPFCHVGPRVTLGDGVTLQSHIFGDGRHDPWARAAKSIPARCWVATARSGATTLPMAGWKSARAACCAKWCR